MKETPNDVVLAKIKEMRKGYKLNKRNPEYISEQDGFLWALEKLEEWIKKAK